MFTCNTDSVGGVNVLVILEDGVPLCMLSLDYPTPHFNSSRIAPLMAQNIRDALLTLSAVGGEQRDREQTIRTIVKGFNNGK